MILRMVTQQTGEYFKKGYIISVQIIWQNVRLVSLRSPTTSIYMIIIDSPFKFSARMKDTKIE